MPGDKLELHVLVTNQGNKGAVINCFFDQASQTLHQWRSSPQKSLALDPQQSNEVTFEFRIPFEALPGTYDYTLVVDAPEHYPEDTPLKYRLQLKVLLNEHTVVRSSDPTFRLQPTTNPSNPVTIKSSEPLMVEVTVQNRSNRVDNFRLTCPDLESDWFTIRYLKTGPEGPGLLSEPGGLNLNPAAFGSILFQIHPPADTLAGNYSPTIRLHSANSPSLVLLDLVYIDIPASYQLEVELNTLRGIRRSSGQYKIKLANRGNTVRELAISAKSRDEEELCTYQCDPSQVQLLPGKTVGVTLTVTPSHWWRRSLWGAGLNLNFQVELQDCQKSPLTENLPQGTLVWKARPWWQFLLLVLVILGLMGGIAFVIWQIFFRSEPLQITDFKTDSFVYTEGNDRVRLSWEIHNPKQLQKLVLKSQKLVTNEVTNELTYQFNGHVLEELNNLQPPECHLDGQVLSCNGVETGVQKSGKYTFVLEAFDRKGNLPLLSDKVEVVINPKPKPKVVSFQPERYKYTEGEQVHLSWEIQNPNQLLKLKIVGKGSNGTVDSEPLTYDFSHGIPNELSNKITNRQQPPCQEQKQVLTCNNITVAAPKAGIYTFELQASDKSGEQPLSREADKIAVSAKPVSPPNIIYFTLNGIKAPAMVSLKVGQPVNLSWQVEGEGVTVAIPPFGNSFRPSDVLKLKPYTQAGQEHNISLTATNQSGQPKSIGFSIEVEAPASSKLSPAPPPLPAASKEHRQIKPTEWPIYIQPR